MSQPHTHPDSGRSNAPSSPRVTRARWAVSAFFFANGAAFAHWVTRIPDIRRQAELSDAQLGLALLGIAIGALLAFPLAGWLIARRGSRTVTFAAGAAYCALLPLLALPAGLPGLLGALLLFGFASGLLDVAMNAQGVEVERSYPYPVMSSFHAFFSLGGLVGAAWGGVMAAAHVSTAAHFLSAALLLLAGLLLAGPLLLRTPPEPRGNAPLLALPPRPLWGLGALAFCAAVSEGAMADWSTVYLREVLATSAGTAALGYAAFSVAMLLGRVFGDRLTGSLGAVTLSRAGGALAAVGLGTALLLGGTGWTLLGFACVGLGMSCAFPLVYSAAGRIPGISPGAGLASVATLGYGGFLLGPAMIGGLSELLGLRLALAVLVALALGIVFLSGTLRRGAAHA
ncbi:MFS family permease [Deinobacterium chartae]|uniref:MFS family permease n=1 Tax=Deinobacterium chartae TaxID=521158 RepID=A0A841I479_9DEIO|nr:MFS transporter [Deinobacterium chartae]MBB6099844.1 MFS family permease [Deinobacterium chartae]